MYVFTFNQSNETVFKEEPQLSASLTHIHTTTVNKG